MDVFSVGWHNTDEGPVVGICDAQILGKTFSCKETSIFIDPSFYGGSMVDENQLEEIFSSAYIVNLLGKEIIATCEKKRLIKKGYAKPVCGIPHIQVLLKNS
ncbi:MAG: DUF424 family protein [Thermoprotei archaeon]